MVDINEFYRYDPNRVYDVECPHCGHQQDIEEMDSIEHNEVFDYDCEDCARSFEVMAVCTWYYELQTDAEEDK